MHASAELFPAFCRSQWCTRLKVVINPSASKQCLMQEGLSAPLHFGNDAEAFRAAREGTVLVDRSHWGRLRLGGNGRMTFLQGQACLPILHLPCFSCTSVIPICIITLALPPLDTYVILCVD